MTRKGGRKRGRRTLNHFWGERPTCPLKGKFVKTIKYCTIWADGQELWWVWASRTSSWIEHRKQLTKFFNYNKCHSLLVSHIIFGEKICLIKITKTHFLCPKVKPKPCVCQENALPMSYIPRLKEKLWKSLIVRLLMDTTSFRDILLYIFIVWGHMCGGQGTVCRSWFSPSMDPGERTQCLAWHQEPSSAQSLHQPWILLNQVHIDYRFFGPFWTTHRRCFWVRFTFQKG